MQETLFERKYPHLSSPLKLGNVVLRNRMVSAPMSFPDIPPDETLTGASSAFYELRAKGGAAAVTISECIVHPETGKSHSIHIDIAKPGNMRGFALAANAIVRHGAAASLQLSHGGMYGGADSVDKSHLAGVTRYGPSDLVLPNGTVVTEMPKSLIKQITESFGKYAAMAKTAGFNMLMIHGGHGWLLHQFLTPLYNKRTDEYGGSVEGRVRFLSEVLDSVRNAVGPDFPLELRMSGADFAPGGYDTAEAAEIAKLIEDKIQLLHISAGIFEGGFAIQHPSMFHERGLNLSLASEIKKHVSVPVATVGGYSDPSMMEEIIASGKADVIVMARALLADHCLPSKICENRDDEIVPCFRCFTCHAERMTSGLRRCAVNPIIGREEENRHIPLSPAPKKVLVAGGGPGGLMAALTAAKRGHSVILCEKEQTLGGALRCERKVPFKADLFKLPAQYGYLAEKAGVEIRLGTMVTPELCAEIQPDALICAVGASPIIPKIPGIDGPNVILGTALSEDGVKIGNKVVVIGGGLVGCEMGLHLAMEGKQVTIVEKLNSIAPDANPRHRPILLEQLKTHGVKCLSGSCALRISVSSVSLIANEGCESEIEADTVICAAGMTPNRDIADSLRNCAPIFMEVGDCVKPGNVVDATTRGYYAALGI